MLNSGDTARQNQAKYNAEATTDPHIVVPSEVSAYTQGEAISIQAFNELILSGKESEAAKPEDELLFGTHIREAAATVKKLFGKS